MTIIKDGTGSGNSVEVDTTNKLAIRGVTQDEFRDISILGCGFFLSTGVLTLTSDCLSFVSYFSNTCDKDLVLVNTIIHLGNALDVCCMVVTGDIIASAVLNPTGGTILCATAGFAGNNNFGSSNAFGGSFLIGGEGITATPLFPSETVLDASGRHEFPSALIIPKGFSIVTGITPPTGNTSMRITVSYVLYFR